MTCIVGLEDAGKVWLGGDSAVSWTGDDAVHAVSHKKVVRRGGLLIGLAGHLGACTLAASVAAPEPYDGGDPREHVLVSLVLPLRATLKKAGLLDEPCDLLIGCGGKLLYAGTDGAVHGFRDGCGAIGSGSSYALGALHAARGTPKLRLRRALEATAHYCASVAGPFYFLHGSPAA